MGINISELTNLEKIKSGERVWRYNENGRIVFPIPEKVKTPWFNGNEEIRKTIDYFPGTMYEMLEQTAKKYPLNIAVEFMGRKIPYVYMIEKIHQCAKSLRVLGVEEGDAVTIAMPNCPQALYVLYAVNLVGAVANMVHPLSAEKEIENYMNISGSTIIFTLDQFYDKVEAIREKCGIKNIVIAKIGSEMGKALRAGYMLTEGRKIARIPSDAPIYTWNNFIKAGRSCNYEYKVERGPQDPAVILYSGGTTGSTKGILISNLSFNALAGQTHEVVPTLKQGDKILSAMPIFHGFGLGVTIHAMLTIGARCILLPRFTIKSYSKIIKKSKCNFIVGVPTLFEGMMRLSSSTNIDLSSLKAVVSGGDSLSVELKKKLDKFLREHKATVQVREGYGLTETLCGICISPPYRHKEGSIGIPTPDNYIKIVRPGTDIEMKYGREGEIVITGPNVMLGYLNKPLETRKSIRKHRDGMRWVHTGDLGTMDSEGYVYFRGRIKRIIISSGYNVYPAQIENVMDAHEKVNMSCAIGVPDSYKMQKVKVFVKLAEGLEASEELKSELMKYARKNFSKYAMPYDIEFRKDLPRTLLGKVAYRVLEEEELSKLKDVEDFEKSQERNKNNEKKSDAEKVKTK